MCGIAALQIKNPEMGPQLGTLLHSMTCDLIERGPDSAGLAVYDDPQTMQGAASLVSLLGIDLPLPAAELADRLTERLEGAETTVEAVGHTTLVRSQASTDALLQALEELAPEASVIGQGSHVAVMKGVGNPREVASAHGLEAMSGTRGVTHTRMATESAVTAAGSHPYSVADDLCLVHNGSFSNHLTVRDELERHGVRFGSDNDSEVAARYVASQLEEGTDLETALLRLGEVFDGFYTLVVTTRDGMAVVRDPIACKPCVVAETDDWVAVASEFRALSELPGIESARVFEPEPGRVYTW